MSSIKYMFSSTKITYSLLTIMLFTPFISYILVVYPGPATHKLYFILLTYGVFFLYYIRGRIKKQPKYIYFLILYIIYLFIWSFFNGAIERRGILPVLINNREIATLFFILIIYNTNFTNKFIKNILPILKITVYIAVIFSIIQVYDNSFFSTAKFQNNTDMFDLNIYQFRRHSIFGFADPNEIGLSFMPLLSILVGTLLYLKKKIYIIILILGGLVAILTNGRYIIISFIILTIQILIVYKVKLSSGLKYVLITAIILFILYQLLLTLGYDIQNWIDQRLFAEGSIKESTRYKAFNNFAIFFPLKPLFGTGVHLTAEIEAASNEIGSSQIHIGYLSHLVSYGIVGSIFLFGFWFLLLSDLYKTAKQTNYWGSFFAFLIYIWAQATLVNYSIYFYGLIFALVFDKYFKDLFASKNIQMSTFQHNYIQIR